jgi:hypothetical protein
VIYIKPLPRCDTHADTQTDGRDFVKYAVESGSGAMTCKPIFKKIVSAIQRFIGGYIDIQTTW